jgi:hypothetical protein
VRLVGDAFQQRHRDPRLADTGLARQQHRLTDAALGAAPLPEDQVDLVLPADERRQRGGMQRLEAAFDRARPQHLPDVHGLGDALEVHHAEVAAIEQVAHQPARAVGDHDGVGLGDTLQPRRQVQGLADGVAFAHLGESQEIAHDDEAAGDADPRLHREAGVHLDGANSRNQLQAGADGLLGVVLARFGVAEVDQRAVAGVPGDEAAERLHGLGHAMVIRGHHLAHVLGIEPRGQRGRPDQVAEQRRELAAFRDVGALRRSRHLLRNRRGRFQRGDRLEQLLAVAEHDAEFLEVGLGQLAQHLGIDGVVPKCLLEERQIKTAKPLCDIQCFLRRPLRPLPCLPHKRGREGRGDTSVGTVAVSDRSGRTGVPGSLQRAALPSWPPRQSRPGRLPRREAWPGRPWR